MRTWLPTWTIEAPAGDPATTSFFGGVPSGLPAERWPVCRECGLVMTPLLHLAPGPWLPRIPQDQVALVFKCESDRICEFWEPDSGANACLLVDRAELGSGPAPLPSDVLDGRTRLLPQVWVGSWEPDDDGITPEQEAAIDDPDRYWDLPDEVQLPHGFDFRWRTKAGGAPYWTANGPAHGPGRPRRLVLQIDTGFVVTGRLAHLRAHVAGFDGAYVHDSGELQAANFCSDGTGYLFDTTPDAPTPTLRFTIMR